MNDRNEKFAKMLIKTIERLARKHKIPMYMMEVTDQIIPFNKGKTEVVNFHIYTGTKPSMDELVQREALRDSQPATLQ